jgi:predicted dehydrogenase
LATRKFRIGIIGAGMITQGSHLPAALASSRATVTAIVDPVVSRAHTLARSYNIAPHISGSVTEVLDHVDGVIIATPNNTHRAIAETCLAKGISTLIEKPLAMTVEDGEAILKAARSSGAVVAVGYYTRYWQSTLLMKELLEAQYFGKIKRFVHQFGTPGGWAPLSAYNLRRDAAGGGVLVVTGSHFLDRMLHYFGYPIAQEMEDDALGGPEANCTANFIFEKWGTRFTGLARYSKTFRLPGGLIIEAERGTVFVPDFEEGEITFYPADTPTFAQKLLRRSPSISSSSFSQQLENFIDASTSKQSPYVDGIQALESLKLIEALYANKRSYSQDWYQTCRNEALQTSEELCA